MAVTVKDMIYCLLASGTVYFGGNAKIQRNMSPLNIIFQHPVALTYYLFSLY
jgi:hypothetical protein